MFRFLARVRADDEQLLTARRDLTRLARVGARKSLRLVPHTRTQRMNLPFSGGNHVNRVRVDEDGPPEQSSLHAESLKSHRVTSIHEFILS